MGKITHINERRIKSILNEQYGITPVRVRKMQIGIANMNYVVHAPPQKFLLKVYNVRRKPLQVGYELRALELLASRDFKCPRTVKTKDKTLFFQEKGKSCALFHYIPGAILNRVTLSRMHDIGNRLGELHILLKREKNTNAQIRETWEPPDVKKNLLASSRYNTKEGALSRFLFKKLNKINFPVRLPSGFTHQDVKPQNIIIDKEDVMHLVDFDNSYRGVLLYDCMTVVIWTCFSRGDVRQELIGSFFKGYEQHRRLTPSEKGFIYDALAFRLIREITVWKTIYGMSKGRHKINLFLSRLKCLENKKSFFTI